MKEKELRLALVYYGGVSLAIYQHGVNIEILNLIRASKAYHVPRSIAQKQMPEHVFTRASSSCVPGEEISTETVYFDLLKAVGRQLDLRVMADVISGSSAGGINAIVLARAIVHDLSIAPLTGMWFNEADILKLISPEARAGKWSKWYVAPFVRLVFARLVREGILPRDAGQDVRRRLSTFVRSRWFKPPLDGPHFSELLLDGLLKMEGREPSEATLLPPETRLDLRITVTDYHGADKAIFMHDPALIWEREHRQMLKFAAERTSQGLTRSDFDRASIPSLAFAARASASYPGAFPPARVREMDALVRQRGLGWPGKEHFLLTNFSHYRQIGLDPEDVVLLDGSILNNKPLQAAIDALRQHTAYREVDRRLVYIDPHPERPTIDPGVRMPGFFATLRSALSDLPRHVPIYEELEETSRFNRQVKGLKAIARTSRRHVEDLIEQATGGALGEHQTVEQIRHWRLTSTNLLASSALIYNAWMRSLVLESIDVIADLVTRICGQEPLSQRARWIRRVVESWAEAKGMFPEDYHIPDTVSENSELPSFGQFIVNFGVRYKARRISHIIQELNSIYQIEDGDFDHAVEFEKVDELKRQVSGCLRGLYAFEEPMFLLKFPSQDIRRLFCMDQDAPLPVAVHYARSRLAELTALVDQIGQICGLVGTNDELDQILSSPLMADLDPRFRRIVLSGYLGWPYSDVVILPAMNALGLASGAFEEILVDRISPQDATSICIEAGCGPLRGETAIGFGGFLTRSARENDYLWGRIHAIERLIDIIASTIDPLTAETTPDFASFKTRAFEAMLHVEEKRLAHIPEVVAAVRAEIEKL
ncbi:patatin-like protein [Novosphingobium album (ex Hu et al. 2023)]|uniref:Patatin-like protein n=1 Tax=Novosphingobium album (ex Hu et al. 2023) TaxID=2930093 RepID=A0ABT0B871_9SPHN|nr:patatin-like protein [Novosphingobium album (ex Hu et al. 2023)]MCJ2181019.1 patatin-like protein [Novosphingobium album (ex Hu et al. 2023)]